jgi:hypothetical protein
MITDYGADHVRITGLRCGITVTDYGDSLLNPQLYAHLPLSSHSRSRKEIRQLRQLIADDQKLK